ncbi:SLAM family member 5-like isoform 2-T2 [Leptodactylus fuscus]|uniref:SLAM family member 5-like isoform X2 n=1 Tax=Leptodactylus fuscus TaxID=238119 RepID=UPI003F4ECBE9
MKLEIFLDLIALMVFSVGEANIQVHKPAILHGSVSLTYSPSQKMETVKLITWKYKNGERISILDTTEKPYFLYPSQFRDRLVIADNLFTLTIKDLTMADSGVYNIEITDINGRLQSSSFTVTVYEPITNASIRTEVKENTTDRCNVTLHCSAPSYTSAFSYTWKYKHRDTGYRMYNNMSSIQISVPRDHQDMELLCIVHNPADQKNVSVRVQEMCNFPDNSSLPRRHLSIIFISLIVIVILVIISIIYIWRKYKIPVVKEKNNREMNYIEVTTTRPREDNQIIQLDNEQYMGMPATRKVKVETVYTTLQHPPPKPT